MEFQLYVSKLGHVQQTNAYISMACKVEFLELTRHCHLRSKQAIVF